MVVPILDDHNIYQFQTCKSSSDIFTEIPVVDLSDCNNAKRIIVEACKDFGFFKVINHGVSMEFLRSLENETAKFFMLSQQDKEKSGPPNPFGYGYRNIGPGGDVGWVEYLLFCTNPEVISQNPKAVFPGIPDHFRCLVNEYVSKVRNMACGVLEMIAEELQIYPKDCLSRLVRDAKSDSCFRLNHYPPCPELQPPSCRKLIGFGEHTDPQIITVVRSNNTPGLQICLKDGSWVSVPPDYTSFYFNVGDALQVMTNGRFKSVKHRVLADSFKSKVSMIFFGGPALNEIIEPLTCLMEQNEEILYKKFTWSEYKKSAYKTRLGDYRLGLFEKSAEN